MKLESLKNDKFVSFKKNEILSLASIVGGLVDPVETTIGGKCDSYDYDTKTPGQTDGAGTPWDFKREAFSGSFSRSFSEY